jgi:hypothetical protein
MKKKKEEHEEAPEWDLSQGMGILPQGVPLTQNIGCVGASLQVQKNQRKNRKNKL